ncbi:chromosome partitioning protein ParA [Burkholderia reimsis]|uniref:Chromosome partitioning protein ParA n=1 Tax=Burkholderia reimsis TaxID=2234132 RepID=A0A365QGW4_9BURK|nr:AAA family ATPase [Burkholderia reimsis]RBB31877.1 chromosome partitioning protein ParA [Burkholderia reimsis]
MIVTVGNPKGGVGKSTLAVQLSLGLAARGQRVWLIDGDRQGTSIGAITVRAEGGREPIPAAAYPDGATLRSQVTQQRHMHDHIIIDAGGRDSTALRAALAVSDVVLIPFLPRSFDVWALNDAAAILAEARAVNDIKAWAVLNAADPQGGDNAEAEEAIQELDGIDLLPARITRRKAIAHASGAGLHIEEYKPRDAAACAEIAALTDTLFVRN